MINILYGISLIVCFLGIICGIFNVSFFIYLGAIINIVIHIIGRITKELKSLSTLFLAFLIGVLVSVIFEIDFTYCVAYCICLENIINFILGIILMNKVNEENDSIYFYTDNCNEFESLIQNWESESKDTTFRIKKLDDYNILITDTAKIVFLFNLMLDISDIYIIIRTHLNNALCDLTTISNEYLTVLSNLIVEYNTKLNKALEIFEDLVDIQYFKYYLTTVKDCLIEYDDIYVLLDKIYAKILTNKVCGCKTDIYLNEYIQELIRLTDKIGIKLEQLQKDINENDKDFSYLKKIDSDKFKNYYKNTTYTKKQ